jgi:uncharacterized membrane protein YfcA
MFRRGGIPQREVRPENMPSIFAPSVLAFAILTFLFAGFVKGMIGMGLPTISMAFLTLALPPAEAASLLIVPSLVTNVWQMMAGPNLGPLARRLWLMVTGIVVGSLAGIGIMAHGETGNVVVFLGLALLAYALLGLSRLRFSVPSRHEWWLAPLVGGATGLISAATGVFAIPSAPYLGSLGMQKDELIQALGLSFTTSTVALGAVLMKNASFHGVTILLSCAALLPSLLGLLLGNWIRRRVREQVFRRVFFLGLLLLGAYFASSLIV